MNQSKMWKVRKEKVCRQALQKVGKNINNSVKEFSYSERIKIEFHSTKDFKLN